VVAKLAVPRETMKYFTVDYNVQDYCQV